MENGLCGIYERGEGTRWKQNTAGFDEGGICTRPAPGYSDLTSRLAAMVGISPSRTEDKGEGGRGDAEVGFEWTFSPALYQGLTDGKVAAGWEIGRSRRIFHVNT